MPLIIKTIPEIIKIRAIKDLTKTSGLILKTLSRRKAAGDTKIKRTGCLFKKLINPGILFHNMIFIMSVEKYDSSTIEKNKTKLVNDFPLAGAETIVTPAQNIKTPTFKILIAKPFAASPK
tara:strand:+ start:159 stop:521 length:363 start_codon:yes stop_codon:yes gene_type:complete